ncbi:hypothetical protein GW17_00050361, partial [Ensete ventricosum]
MFGGAPHLVAEESAMSKAREEACVALGRGRSHEDKVTTAPAGLRRKGPTARGVRRRHRGSRLRATHAAWLGSSRNGVPCD